MVWEELNHVGQEGKFFREVYSGRSDRKDHPDNWIKKI